GRVIGKEAVKYLVIVQKVNCEDVVKRRTEGTSLRRTCLYISYRREYLINSYLELPISEEFADDNGEIVREGVRNKLCNEAFMPHAFKSVPDIQEDTSSIMFNIEAIDDFIGDS
ncbi:hypothetical protein AVEN_201251-1, partial [Araneus ventricosus]